MDPSLSSFSVLSDILFLPNALSQQECGLIMDITLYPDDPTCGIGSPMTRCCPTEMRPRQVLFPNPTMLRFPLITLSHSQQPRGTPAAPTIVSHHPVPTHHVLSASSVSPSPFAPRPDRPLPSCACRKPSSSATPAFSTSSDSVAGHTLLSYETLAETLKALEREIVREGR